MWIPLIKFPFLISKMKHVFSFTVFRSKLGRAPFLSPKFVASGWPLNTNQPGKFKESPDYYLQVYDCYPALSVYLFSGV